jgi:DNA adenine methylase
MVEAPLKWAGGKRWLIRRVPQLFEIEFERYIEPFVGSAAVFFHLLPKHALLSDKNTELINLYAVLKDDPLGLLERMRLHALDHSKLHYYATRSSSPTTRLERAARFLYLNRTCWNGLYRENRRGEFNGSLGVARIGDLVFIDPPYTTKHNNNGFVKYNEQIFSWDDQVRLASAVREASDRGARIIVTNANHESVVDLYRDLAEPYAISRQSVLAGSAAARGLAEEAVFVIGNGTEKAVAALRLSPFVRQGSTAGLFSRPD